ncbi:MAG TPA: hypothetical protein VGK17_18095, partial [Propionicimonas sp.]
PTRSTRDPPTMPLNGGDGSGGSREPPEPSPPFKGMVGGSRVDRVGTVPDLVRGRFQERAWACGTMGALRGRARPTDED